MALDAVDLDAKEQPAARSPDGSGLRSAFLVVDREVGCIRVQVLGAEVLR